MNVPELIQILRQHIRRCYQQYQLEDNQKIYAKFDRTLFSEDFQTFKFYRLELENTLTQIAKLQAYEQIQCQFYTEKLLAQLQVLLEAIQQVKSSKVQPKQEKPSLSSKEKQKHEIHRLPPRERLTKYYEALQALNEKIARQQDQYQQATNDLEKAHCQQLLHHTQQRRTRCLEAIELLEEYLAFKENNS